MGELTFKPVGGVQIVAICTFNQINAKHQAGTTPTNTPNSIRPENQSKRNMKIKKERKEKQQKKRETFINKNRKQYTQI